ncbi:MAG: hypothetical protein A3F84_07155 [Candidatus Handelsmanbacteria bacterium RIFCSPLOWO2_12_FULL_64_10]|uniref:Solute-binding protein family 5 domain-containing protein n=1 Tax=Handelsmanbacteria sp. (strain RIFCSPLOWO2_12_FULL_64_10) TaxID=1817868 RepID=A0A1F6C5V2_HANXR|nr:MAG: hypothetical protein A3F84_07155 [Candidatus Handelsmanbacteria bacterium RIFCSPLOWO2_12_FULL_64_10]
MKSRSKLVSIAIVGLLTLTACSPVSTGTGSAEQTGASVAPPVEKTLRVAIGAEPVTWDSLATGGSASPTAGGINNLPSIGMDGMRRLLTGGERINLLAAEVPDVAKGTWKINPDNSMDMTWKIVPNAKWHDGVPVTSADFVFGVAVHSDPESQRNAGGANLQRLLASATAIDDRTFVAHWSGIAVSADDGTGLDPMPKHILESVYKAGREELTKSRHFTTEFIGTGPFKLVHREAGQGIEFERFNDYYRGPAKISHLILQFIPDPNTMVANILAGSVDVVLPQGVNVDTAYNLKQRWDQEGSGHQVLFESRDGIAQWEIMLNPQYARPVNAMTQQPVRQALLQAIDRQALVNEMTLGLSPVAYTVYHPDDPYYPYVKDLLPPQNPQYAYPYDVQKAQQLLAGAGWIKGPDGVLADQKTGDRFTYQVLTRTGSDPFKQASIVQDYWKAIGVALDIHVLTPAESADNQFISTRTGASFNTASGSAMYGGRMSSRSIPSEATRWTGNNRGHFSSPALDSVIAKLESTIDANEQRSLHRQLLAASTEPVPFLFFYYEIRPILMVKGVTGPRLVDQVSSGNVWVWDKN